EVGDQLHLFFGLPTRHWNHGAAEPFGTVMRSQAAGEETVAVADVNDVTGAPAGGSERARHEIRPGRDVACRVADHRWLPCRPARRVDAHDPHAGDGEEAKWIGVA